MSTPMDAFIAIHFLYVRHHQYNNIMRATESTMSGMLNATN